MTIAQYGFEYAQRQLLRSRNPLRRFVKEFYLRNILQDVCGPTIDFGCGAGQLLESLPAGSVGFDVNVNLVNALQERGLDARLYKPSENQFSLLALPKNYFKTFVMAHVLEHFEDAAEELKRILNACNRLGIQRVVIVVPGEKGFLFDDTHKTFINRQYLIEKKLLNPSGYSIVEKSYFPINWEYLGRWFKFHEFKFIYEI